MIDPKSFHRTSPGISFVDWTIAEIEEMKAKGFKKAYIKAWCVESLVKVFKAKGYNVKAIELHKLEFEL